MTTADVPEEIMREGARDVERDLAANPFPGSIPVPDPNGPVRYMSPGGGSWMIDNNDPYFHQTPDGSFKVPADYSGHTGGEEATVAITEQKLDPGVVRIEVDIDEVHDLVEVDFIVRNRRGGSPDAVFYLSNIPEEDEDPAWYVLGTGTNVVRYPGKTARKAEKRRNRKA